MSTSTELLLTVTHTASNIHQQDTARNVDASPGSRLHKGSIADLKKLGMQSNKYRSALWENDVRIEMIVT